MRVVRCLGHLALCLVLFHATEVLADRCGGEFSYSKDVSGTFLMACSVAAGYKDPVAHSAEQAADECEFSHQLKINDIHSSIIPNWRRTCERQDCDLTYIVVDNVDCSSANGYSYCKCGSGSNVCRQVRGGVLVDPALTTAECRSEFQKAYPDGSIRMVRGCDSRVVGGAVSVFAWCVEREGTVNQ